MKKFLPYIVILILLTGLFSPVVDAQEQEEGNEEAPLGTCYNIPRPNDPMPGSFTFRDNVTDEQCKNELGGDEWRENPPAPSTPPETLQDAGTSGTSTRTTYTPLAPLPGLMNEDGAARELDTATECAFGKYMNSVISLIIGLIAVAAVVMIVIGGIQYMTSELISSKGEGKDRIRNALLGLLIALGAYVLLFTINKQLVEMCLDLPEVEITITPDQANFARTESSSSTVGTGYTVSGTVSPGVSDFVSNYGASLNNITVDTATGRANFCAGTNCVSVPINIGQGGVADIGQAKSGDLKTPKGNTTIGGDIRIGNSGNAALSLNGYNLGAAFINIGATINGADRGIGFHGSYNNNLGTTNGCIRMRNDDLVVLAPYMKPGVRVIIR